MLLAKPEIAQYDRKAHMIRGFYTATLVLVDENVRENKFGGTQILAHFEISPGLIRLPVFLPWQYKLDDGKLVTALTPKGLLTRCATALGYKYGEVLDLSSLVGRTCEVLIDDAKKMQQWTDKEGVLVSGPYSIIKEFRTLTTEQKVTA
jgi:hypothetical protein